MDPEENLDLYESFYEELPASYANDTDSLTLDLDTIDTDQIGEPATIGLSSEQVSRLADDSMGDATSASPMGEGSLNSTPTELSDNF